MNKQLKKIFYLLLALNALSILNQNVNAMDNNLLNIWKSIENNDIQQIKAKKMINFMIEKGYMIFEELGRGYHGIVYRAKSPANKNVALKFTYHNAHEVYGTGKFFLGDIGLYNKTVETKANLGPGLCKIFGYEKEDFSNSYDYNVCIVLEYIKGENLGYYINKHNNITYEKTLQWIKNICASLNEMHKLGYAHRDISKFNIIVDGDLAVLADFGKALNYNEYLVNYPGLNRTLLEFSEDLFDITNLIKWIISHSNYQKSKNDEKLESLCKSNTFSEFYEKLRALK